MPAKGCKPRILTDDTVFRQRRFQTGIGKFTCSQDHGNGFQLMDLPPELSAVDISTTAHPLKHAALKTGVLILDLLAKLKQQSEHPTKKHATASQIRHFYLCLSRRRRIYRNSAKQTRNTHYCECAVILWLVIRLRCQSFMVCP